MTDTMSRKDALEILGFGPCHHMSEMVGRVSRCNAFTAAYQGAPHNASSQVEGLKQWLKR
jgi:hypothetical protein